MDTELIRKVVEEVVKRMGEVSQTGKEERKRNVLVIITGGTVGAQVAFEQLSQCLERNRCIRYQVVLSRSGAKIHDPDKVKELLRAEKVLVDGENARSQGIAMLMESELVVVPVLTRNTAARVAALFLDTLPSEIIVEALSRGKDVLAVPEAADPTGPAFVRLGLSLGKPALVNEMKRVLVRLEEFGVRLVSSESLCEGIESILWGKGKNEACTSILPCPARTKGIVSPMPRRLVVSKSDLESLVGEGGVVRLPEGAVLTPLARDAIREAGLKVVTA